MLEFVFWEFPGIGGVAISIDLKNCIMFPGDIVGTIPEKQSFNAFPGSFSQTMPAAVGERKQRSMLIAFPVLLLRHCPHGGIEKVLWQQHAWIPMLIKLNTTNNSSNNSSSNNNNNNNKRDTLNQQENNLAVIAGLIRPFMLKIAPRRTDLIKMIPYLSILQCTSQQETIYDDNNHKNPKKLDRLYGIVGRGKAKVSSVEEEDILHQRHQERSKKQSQQDLGRGSLVSPFSIVRAGEDFGILSSFDTRRFTIKSTSKNTIVLFMSEMCKISQGTHS